MSYHKGESAFFLFGGFCSDKKSRLNDLWRYDATGWTSLDLEIAPSPRSGHAMVYDEARKRLVVFGGKNNDGKLLNDTWAWKGGSWKRIKQDGPPLRQSHRLVFNSDDGGIYLFGGSDADGKSLGDIWVFSNDRWKELKPSSSPPARRQHTLAYDRSRKRIVLFGGFDRPASGKVVYGDTWEFDGSEWKKLSEDSALARDHHAMAYHDGIGKTVLFGGYNGGYLADTWSWNGEKWSLLDDDGPARAGKPILAFQASTGSLVLFGGWGRNNAPLMDFWKFKFEARSWSKIQP